MQLTDKKKYTIIALDEEGFTQLEIANKLKVNQSTVSRIIKKHNKYTTVAHMGCNGRTLAISNNMASIIKREKVKNPKNSLRKMAKTIEKETAIKVSHNTIKNWYNSHNIFAFDPISKPLLTKRHKLLRYEAAKRILFMPEDDIKRIIFSDESKFNLFYSDGKVSVWREPGTGLKSENLNKTIKHGGGSINVWGCFSYRGIGNLEVINGIMDAPSYVDIISRNLAPSSIKMNLPDFIFQQDNDPKHTARLASDYFDDQDVNMFDRWPPQSPDLNPIENLWSIIKVKVAEKQPKNINGLKEIVRQVWSEIPIGVCQKYVLSFKKRALAIYRAKGGHINY